MRGLVLTMVYAMLIAYVYTVISGMNRVGVGFYNAQLLMTVINVAMIFMMLFLQKG